jgi:hypothetical protein
MADCLMSVVTADHFQHYIPIYIYAIRKFVARDFDIRIYVRGQLDDATTEALDVLRNAGIANGKEFLVMDAAMDYPFTVSATNTLRFLIHDKWLDRYWYTLITDIDLMLFKDPIPWHIIQMTASGLPFAGHHGPWHKPHRPEIAPAWTGNFERVAGGFFCVSPQWYEKTKRARYAYSYKLKREQIGHFRESDEVTLANIIKDSGMPVPTQKGFPSDLRGLHFGDFKESMTHRWTDMAKMKTKLTDENCRAFLSAEADPVWRKMMTPLTSSDIELLQIFENVRIHIGQRGVR